MYHVKLSIANDNAGCNRQLPDRGFVWGNYQFHINEDVPEADFWVVYSKGQRKTESCKCSPKNTLFVTGEPETVYHYSHQFVKQFARVISVQAKIRHSNMRMVQPAQPWHIGKITENDEQGIKVEYSQDYDSLKNAIPQKSKQISIITSNKCFTQGHKDRIDFALKLKEHYKDSLDLFGYGFNDFTDKWNVIAPYKYHICIENSSYSHYWTEKLADCYLGWAFPFYYGCPNLSEYFSQDAFLPINIHDVDAAIAIIDKAIEQDLLSQRQHAILQARLQVLDKYNLFALLTEEFDKMNPNARKQNLMIKSDTSFVDLKKVQIMVLNRLKHKFLK
jgi:hypothetical protein